METTAPQAPSEIPVEWAISSFVSSFDSKVKHLDVTWEYLLGTPVTGPGGYLSSEGWNKLEPFLAEEIAAQSRERLKQTLRQAVRERLIRDWIARYAGDISAEEQRLATRGIESYLEQDSREDLESYLEALLTLGIAAAEKKRKTSGRTTNYLQNAWAVLLGTTKVAIAFTVLSAAASRFETIVLAMLVLIYISAEAAHTVGLQASIGNAIGVHRELKCIHQTLDSYEYTEDRQALIQEQRDIKKVLQRGTVRIYVARAVAAVIWLLAVWKLVSAIVA